LLTWYLGESTKSWLDSLPSSDTDLARVLSDKSPVELERRRLPSTGLFAGDCAWIKVLWIILTSLPSFHGDKLGSVGTVTVLAGCGEGDQPNGPGVGPNHGICEDSSAASKHNGS